MSPKAKYLHFVVDSLVRESKLLWKPTLLTFDRDGGWRDVRVSVPFNNHVSTSSDYFKNSGTHQELFVTGFRNFVEDIFDLNEGEKYFVYNLYIKKMKKIIKDFIKQNENSDDTLNEENIFKKYGRKLYSKVSGIKHVDEKFVEKLAKYIEQRWDEVINVTWTYDMYQKIVFTVYIDEDDGQPTDIVQHPLQWEISKTIDKEWHLNQKGSHLWMEIKVVNLNKDTKLRSSIRESYNRYDETIPNKKFVDEVVKRMVDKTEVNLYMSDYDPWTTHSPFFGNFITPQFPHDKRYKFNISWLLDEHFEKMSSFIKYFGAELVNTYGFTTNGELKYFDSQYVKKLKEKVEALKIPLIEKRLKQKEEYNKKYNLSESKKDVKKEMDEIQRVVQDLSRHHNFNTTVEDVSKEIENATPQPLKYKIWNQLENSESVDINKGDFDEVFKIANKYKKGNPLKLKKKFIEGNYRPPIIARFDDRYWLVAGNTRLCTAKAMGINPNVLIIDLNKTYPVDEGKTHSIFKQYINENLT